MKSAKVDSRFCEPEALADFYRSKELGYLTLRVSAFSRARARNRMGFFEHDYEQEHEHKQAKENID
ncbi:MAG: hypothetical protein WCI02_09715 [Planctomycetota bacterium]|jgi:hypothetical protein